MVYLRVTDPRVIDVLCQLPSLSLPTSSFSNIFPSCPVFVGVFVPSFLGACRYWYVSVWVTQEDHKRNINFFRCGENSTDNREPEDFARFAALVVSPSSVAIIKKR